MVSRNKGYLILMLSSMGLMSSFSRAACESVQNVEEANQVESVVEDQTYQDSQEHKIFYKAAKRYFKERGFESVKPTSKSESKVGRGISKAFKKVTGVYKTDEHRYAQKLFEYTQHYYRSLKLVVLHKPFRAFYYNKVNEYYHLLLSVTKNAPSYLRKAHDKWEALHQVDKESKGYLF